MNTSVNASHRFTQRVFFNYGYSSSRLSTTLTQFCANQQSVSGDLGITGNNQDPLNWGPPGLNFSSGIQGLADGRASITHNETNGLTAGLFWNHSPHNFRFGVD